VAVTIDPNDLKRRIDRFTEQTGKLRSATGKTRQVMTARLTEQAGALNRDRTALAAQLNTQHEWLFANPEHPQFRAFEDRWLVSLTVYEQASDALAGFAVTLEIAA
jgi:hypothetical protein